VVLRTENIVECYTVTPGFHFKCFRQDNTFSAPKVDCMVYVAVMSTNTGFSLSLLVFLEL